MKARNHQYYFRGVKNNIECSGATMLGFPEEVKTGDIVTFINVDHNSYESVDPDLLKVHAARVGNRPSVTRQTAEQTAEIFDLVSSRLMISGTKDISSVCSPVFKSSSSTIDVHFE